MTRLVDIKSPVKKFIKMENENKLLHKIYKDFEVAAPIFEDKQKARNKNIEYYSNKQWSDSERAAHEQQFRKAFVFNEIQHKVDHLIGTQTQTRLDSSIQARERTDEAAAELLSHIVKWVEQINSIEYVETDVFSQALLGGFGAAVVRWEMEDVNYGYPVVESVPPNELFWDPNFKKPDLSDARWLGRLVYKTRMEVLEMFPQYEKQISRARTSDVGSQIASRLNIERTDYQDDVMTQMSTYSDHTEGRDILEVIEHYERFKRYVYVVADDISGRIDKFTDEGDAESYYDGLVDEYTKQGMTLLNPDGTPRVVLITNSTDAIQQTVIIGDQILYSKPIAYPDFPYVLNFAYLIDGEYWGFVDSLIDPQDLVNRFFSQWDYQLGTSSKNAVTVMDTLLPRGFGLEDFRREFSSTTPVIPVLSHEAMQQHQNVPVNPELFQGIMFGIGRMNDYAGGRNALGLQENAAESGRAVIARAEAGGTSRLPLFDKLRLWRRNVTLRIVWLIKNYMPTGQMLRIIGTDDDVQYVDVDDGLIDSLHELKYDVVIDEAVKSDTMKERNFEQLKELFSTIQIPAEIALPILIEFSNLPGSKKRELLQQIESYQVYQQQKAAAEKEQKITQEVQDSLKRKRIKEQLERQEELDEVERDTNKKKNKIKTELDDIEEARLALQQGTLSPSERNRIYEGARTRGEIGDISAANILGNE